MTDKTSQTDEPVNELENKPAKEQGNKPLNKAENEMINEPANKAENEMINKPLNKAENGMINEPLNKAENEMINEPANKAENEIINKPLNKAENGMINKPLNKAENEMINEPLNKAENGMADTPANESENEAGSASAAGPEQPFSAENPNERSYIAFISYRHTPLDREAAERVQKKIENYIVPREFREQNGGTKLGLCFRDEDELPASSSLTDSIYYALDHTKFLIVICTPNLPLSKWCEAEIRYFLKTHDRDHILAVLADGDPSESFSPYMLHDYDEKGNIVRDWEPLAANIAGEGHKINNKAFKKEIVRLYAALIGCPFDSLWQREKRARTNRLLTAAALAVAVLAVFLGVVVNRNAQIREANVRIQEQNDKITAQNDELFEKNEEIQEQNDQIKEQNEKIEEQNTSLQTQLSTAMVDSGRTRLEGHDIKGALSDALSAVENYDPKVCDPRAEKLLADGLGAYKNREIRCSVVYEQTTDITGLYLTDDEKHVLLRDSAGVIRCLDAEDYSVVWTVRTGNPDVIVYTGGQTDQILYKTEAGLYCISLQDGAVRWSYEYSRFRDNNFQAISDDGKIFALLDRTGTELGQEDEPLYLLFLDTRSGSELGRTELECEGYTFRTLYYPEFAYGAAFSENSSIFIAAVPAASEGSDTNDSTLFFRVDMNSYESRCVCEVSAYMDKFYGFDIDEKEDSVFYASLVSRVGSIYTDLWTRAEDAYYQSKTKLSTHKISSVGGFNDTDDNYRVNECFYLSDDDSAFVFSDNMLFIFDRSSNAQRQVYSMSGRIINAYWLDRENGLMEIVCSDGYFLDYTFGRQGDSVVKKMSGEEAGQGDLIKACPLRGGFINDPDSGAALAVSGSFPGRLLYVDRASDPHGIQMDLDPGDFEYLDEIIITPGSDTAYCIYNGYNMAAFDKKTGEIKQTAVFKDYLGWENIIPLSEDSFLMGSEEYSLDGTKKKYAEPADGTYPSLNIRLSDGRILSYCTGVSDIAMDEMLYDLTGTSLTDYEYPEIFPVWLDGKLIPETGDMNTGLICMNGHDSRTMADAGENGLVMVYGKAVKFGENGTEAGEKSSFNFINALTSEITAVEEPYPDSGEFRIAFGSREPWIAAVYDDGTVCIIDAADGTVKVPEKTYAAGETAAFCFADEDAYLLILSNTGELDVYDAASMKLLSEEQIGLFSELLRGGGGSISELSARRTADGNRLFVLGSGLRSFGVFIDISAHTVTQEAGQAYAYDPDTGCVYTGGQGNGLYSDSSKLTVYPYYSLNDLKEWAEDELSE